MSLSRVLRVSLGIAGISLAGFHGWLFFGQILAGRFQDPWVIFRWASAALLVAALVAVRRSGDSVLGRRGIAIWVLAALLHGPAIAAETTFDTIALPEAVATSVLQLASSLALAAGLWLLTGLPAARRRFALRLAASVPTFAAGPLASGVAQQFCPRPPPLRS